MSQINQDGGQEIINFYLQTQLNTIVRTRIYEGWNFNSGNYLFTTDTK